LAHGFPPELGKGVSHLTSKWGKGSKIALVGGLDPPLDAILGLSDPALEEAFAERFEGDVLESIALKKFAGLGVYVV
jgi:hypothetical protein